MLLTLMESFISGMLGACEAMVALDCVDNLDAFEVLAFLLRPGFGAVVPAKMKKGHPGERR